MKKFSLFAVAAFSVAASGAAVAAYPQLTGGPNDVTMVDCSLLANDIQLVLSNNVVGGVQCNTTDNFVAISLCHTSGQSASRSAVVTTDDQGNITCTISPTENCVETVSGSSFPTASTLQGTVAVQFPGQACTETTATAVADAQTAP